MKAWDVPAGLARTVGAGLGVSSLGATAKGDESAMITAVDATAATASAGASSAIDTPRANNAESAAPCIIPADVA